MGETKKVEKVLLRTEQIEKIFQNKVHQRICEEIQKEKTKLNEEYQLLLEKDWIAFQGELKGYYHTKIEIAIPIFEKYTQVVSKCWGEVGISIPIAVTKSIFKCYPKEIEKGIMSSKSFGSKHYIRCLDGSYCIEDGTIVNWTDNDSIPLTFIPIKKTLFEQKIKSGEFKIDLSINKIHTLIELDEKDDIFQLSNEEINKYVDNFAIDKNKIEKEIKELFDKEIQMDGEDLEFFCNELLACDNRRADLECYDKKCLEDVNAGHWELWFDRDLEAEEDEKVVEITKSLIARNPVKDIRKDGLIGIDFGTKSTIVSKQDGSENISLMRIGIGQLNKKVEEFHFENPTVMEFVDLNKFLEEYHKKQGRPYTSIQDITVSHKASNNMKECSETDYFYSYFYDIKQWCGNTEHKVKIVDQKGMEHLIEAFVCLNEEEINPLEIYAYYLGLYINNMRNQIYTDYVLSFPVSYEKAVREKILESFTNGLKKSLPQAVLNDEEAMASFRVRQGVSEPAAYAITALKEYGLEPDEEEEVLYSVFDFGGGTSDFDFGMMRWATDTREEERYDYVIEQFGSEGDKYLGGENLLMLLAYEVFKANADRLKRNENSAGFSFSQPKEYEKENVVGAEMLISDSQEAKRNMKQLMEVLRPFWEGIVSIDKSNETKTGKIEKTEQEVCEENTISYGGYILKQNDVVNNVVKAIVEDGVIKVDLFDKNGQRQAAQTLYIKKEDVGIDVNLISILEKRIKMGVDNFFSSIESVFKNKELSFETEISRNQNLIGIGNELETKEICSGKTINVFFAGNSSKSPILKKVFSDTLKKLQENGESRIKEMEFKLYPPLGTKEAMQIQRENGIEVDGKDMQRPTGKTGVAYGLILGRDGGNEIKVIPETATDKETKFRFNIGKARRQKFSLVMDRNIEYNQWVRFIDAGKEDFEIYYTSLPDARNMSVKDAGVKKINCRIAYVDPELDVFIRAISPNEIEYVIASEYDLQNPDGIVGVKLEN